MTSTSLALVQESAVASHQGGTMVQRDFNREQIDLIKQTVAVGASDLELQLFLHYCKATGLDPIGRQIHWVKRGDKGTIQVGIDGYRLLADRTGRYVGNDDAVFSGNTEDGFPSEAQVTVYKLVGDTPFPFRATARWAEYAPYYRGSLSDMWRKMPHTMLAKCAEALALRKAFPAELAQLYTNEEMEQASAEPLRPQSSTSRPTTPQPTANARRTGAGRGAPESPHLKSHRGFLTNRGIDPQDDDASCRLLAWALQRDDMGIEDRAQLTDEEWKTASAALFKLDRTAIPAIIADPNPADEPAQDVPAESEDGQTIEGGLI